MSIDEFGNDSVTPIETTLTGGVLDAMLTAVCDMVYQALQGLVNAVDTAGAALNGFLAQLQKQLMNYHMVTPKDELMAKVGEAVALARSILPYNLIDEVQRYIDLINKCNFFASVTFGNPMQLLTNVGEAMIEAVYGVIVAAFSLIPEINMAITLNMLKLLIFKVKLPTLCDQVNKAFDCLDQCCHNAGWRPDISLRALKERFITGLNALFLTQDADFNFEEFTKSIGLQVDGMTPEEAWAALRDGTNYVQAQLCTFVDGTTGSIIKGMDQILKALDFSKILKFDEFPKTIGD
jgi:hypothetical protein